MPSVMIAAITAVRHIDGVPSEHHQNDVVKGASGTCLALDDILHSEIEVF